MTEPFCEKASPKIVFFCPKCHAEIPKENINGLCYVCPKCDYCDDSTFDMIMSVSEKVKDAP